jgi:hypothetical protein
MKEDSRVLAALLVVAITLAFDGITRIVPKSQPASIANNQKPIYPHLTAKPTRDEFERVWLLLQPEQQADQEEQIIDEAIQSRLRELTQSGDLKLFLVDGQTLTLTATLSKEGTPSLALIRRIERETENGETFSLVEGDAVGDYKVSSINMGTIQFSATDGREIYLKLYDDE